jgi:hypothetical protein
MERRILSTIVGVAQEIVGIVFAALTVLLAINIIEVHTLLTAPPEFLPVYLMILGLFSIFSIISGFFLINELWGNR